MTERIFSSLLGILWLVLVLGGVLYAGDSWKEVTSTGGILCLAVIFIAHVFLAMVIGFNTADDLFGLRTKRTPHGHR